MVTGHRNFLRAPAVQLYGTGMRLMECVRLRVKDVDFERAVILVRDGRWMKSIRT